MNKVKPRPAKSGATLTLEWDRLAEERHRQIASGEDVSFEYVTVPLTWSLLQDADYTRVIDIGAGTGDFTIKLAAVAGKVIAIEPSRASIDVARRVCSSARNVRFIEAALEEAATYIGNEPITAAVALMTLMTAPDLRGFANALASLLPPGAQFVAVLTHPWFWSAYWGYEKKAWFQYYAEIFIEAPFKISKRKTDIKTTHIHRPLEQYVTVFEEKGFKLEALAEPMPPAEVQALYPEPWRFPRFMGIRWRKAS